MVTSVVSFMDAIRNRYGSPDGEDAHGADALLVGDPSRRRNKKWELVGMEKTRLKQADHTRLVHVVLRGMNITTGERSEGELAAAALNRLQEVDISENPLLSMRDVGVIARHLPALTVLQLSDNPDLLRGAAAGTTPLLVSVHLRKLVLHNVGLRSIWQLRALVDLPALEELHLEKNNIQCLKLLAEAEETSADYLQANAEAADDKSRHWFPNVTTLSLAQNELSSWGRDSGLNETMTTAFPRVTRLFLTGNCMPNLYYENITAISNSTATTAAGDNGNDYAYLRPLELLCVKDNTNINDPRTLEALQKLCPQLHTFRITYSAMFPQWNETLGRMYVVASFPSITTLNRGHVRPKERLDSEIFYVQRGLVAKQQLEGQKAADQKTQEESKEQQQVGLTLHFPLLETLREKHKDVIMAIYRDGETASHDGISQIMLHLTFRCDGFEQVTKTVPSSMTVGKLKALVRAIFGVVPSYQRLSFFSGDAAVIERPMELDNELQSLAFYGVSDGALVQVIDTSLR
ncbi:tubulin-specific chaperone E [Trypanosoma rangeli]|uniref:Tubulin-specific chaperone E n=1 Tax=Trypanosoma rangeli TaxID=5698 RepID=A0A422NHN6_TRYRA|nr:tubulin-specific chaperone E [Trypanosoma rangeli]RNF04959.1 tubulin-specific chaperone E [Trypanosoma rangeli]|eukprot:RNF04959.1 tubulin-specific chaperone E [Trypanosoma rangeli]